MPAFSGTRRFKSVQVLLPPMPRTTASDVKELFDTEIPDPIVSSWIDIANEAVDDIEDAAPSASSSRLKKIEKLWTAHLLTAQDPRIESASGESRSVDYGDRTSYRELAIGLDPTNTLAGMGKPSASVAVPDAKGIND